METTDINELNSTLKTSPANIEFINYQNFIIKTSSSDMDNSFFDSPQKEKVCYNTISESKRFFI